MTVTFATDNIDHLQAVELASGGWTVTFRSGNIALHHQLYVNGKLADFTDTAAQREFHLELADYPRQIVIAAVDRDHRTAGFSDLLGPDGQTPWVYEVSLIKPPHSQASRIALMGDHATGLFDDEPLMTLDLQPDWDDEWGFGSDSFGVGGAGYSGSTAPGAGKGAFGVGEFGIDAHVLTLRVALGEDGDHQLRLRVTSKDGLYADGPTTIFSSTPPPAVIPLITATSYDNQTETLTLQIQ